MAERFLKLIPSKDSRSLARKHPNAFILLFFIADRARRENGDSDGLTPGQCHIGDHNEFGLTEKEYRTAKKVLVYHGYIKIVETCRTRKKNLEPTWNQIRQIGATERATRKTTKGTLVELCNSDIYDINIGTEKDAKGDQKGDTKGDQRATKGRRTRMTKKEEEDHHPYPSASGLTDDFSSKVETVEVCEGVFMSQKDLELCIQLKGNIEKVREAVLFIQGSAKRKHDITDWPNALATWKIENKAKVNTRENMNLAEKLCRQFEDFSSGNGWRIRFYTDKNKDQKGILFESESTYNEAVFVALIDGEFKQKCRDLIEKNIVIKK